MTAGVFEHIVDSATGIPTGPMDCLVAGVSNGGTTGEPHLISKKSDIKGTLGVGPLVERIHDIFQEDTGELGRNINLVAVPVAAGTTPTIPTADHTGSGIAPGATASGTQLIGMQLVVRIDKGGDVGTAEFNYSLDGGDNFESLQPIITSSSYPIPDSGINIDFAAGTYVVDDTYAVDIGAPAPDIGALIGVDGAVINALDEYDVRRVYIVGPSDNTDWVAMGTLANSLFAQHKPTSFILEFRGRNPSEDYQQWAQAALDMKATGGGVTHPYVDVVAAIGEAIDKNQKIKMKSLAGLFVGRTLSIKTNRHIGRVKSGKVNGLVRIHPGYLAIQEILENAGMITVTNFAGLSGYYWGDDRTLAEETSTYKHIRPRETVFKALRLARAVALQYIRDEAGTLSGETGLSALKSDIETIIFNAMIGPSSEQELTGIQVDIPPGQDPEIGIDVDLHLIGVPVIQKISLYAKYTADGASLLSEAA